MKEDCRICGSNRSTGFHFGTVTCEACKVRTFDFIFFQFHLNLSFNRRFLLSQKFFMRQAGEQTKLACQQNTGKCVIILGSRTKCQYCRFKKCLQLGMSIQSKSIDSVVSQTCCGQPLLTFLFSEPQKETKSKPDVLCQVCKAKSAGFHYGALTCQRCKVSPSFRFLTWILNLTSSS